MAKVQFINGILSGKLGGTVYARNKSGHYVRAYTVGNNPNTIAQAQARAAFASSGSAWHSLSDDMKAQWNSFAQEFFKPKDGRDALVQYTGFNAYVSLTNEVINANRLTRVTELSAEVEVAPPVVPGPPTPPLPPIIPSYTIGQYIQTQTAPINDISSKINVIKVVREITGLGLMTAELNVSGTLTTRFSLDNPAALTEFTDAKSNQPLGIAFFASEAQAQAQVRTTNPGRRILGVTPVLSGLSTAASPIKTFDINFTDTDLDISAGKLWYTPGQTVEISAYLISQNGQTQPIGTVKSLVVS